MQYDSAVVLKATIRKIAIYIYSHMRRRIYTVYDTISIAMQLPANALWRAIGSLFSGFGPLNPIDGTRLNFHTIQIVMWINRITRVNHIAIFIVAELMYPQTRLMYCDIPWTDAFVALLTESLQLIVANQSERIDFHRIIDTREQFSPITSSKNWLLF